MCQFSFWIQWENHQNLLPGFIVRLSQFFRTFLTKKKHFFFKIFKWKKLIIWYVIDSRNEPLINLELCCLFCAKIFFTGLALSYYIICLFFRISFLCFTLIFRFQHFILRLFRLRKSFSISLLWKITLESTNTSAFAFQRYFVTLIRCCIFVLICEMLDFTYSISYIKKIHEIWQVGLRTWYWNTGNSICNLMIYNNCFNLSWAITEHFLIQSGVFNTIVYNIKYGCHIPFTHALYFPGNYVCWIN